MVSFAANVCRAWSVLDHTLVVGFGLFKSSEYSNYPASGIVMVSSISVIAYTRLTYTVYLLTYSPGLLAFVD